MVLLAWSSNWAALRNCHECSLSQLSTHSDLTCCQGVKPQQTNYIAIKYLHYAERKASIIVSVIVIK